MKRKSNVQQYVDSLATPTLSKDELIARSLESVVWEIDQNANEFEKVRTTLIERFTKSKNIAREFEWLDGAAVDAWLNQYFAIMQLQWNDEDTVPKSAEKMLGILRWHRDDVMKRILGNFDRPSSTSSFHNASMLAKQEANSRLIERLNTMIHRIERHDEENGGPK